MISSSTTPQETAARRAAAARRVGPTMRIIRAIKIERVQWLKFGEERGHTIATHTGAWFWGDEAGIGQIKSVSDDVHTRPMFYLVDSNDEVEVPQKVAAALRALHEYAAEHPRMMDSLGSIEIFWEAPDKEHGILKPFFSVVCETSYSSDSRMGWARVIGVCDEGDHEVGFCLADGSVEVRVQSPKARAFIMGIFELAQHL